MLTVCVHRENGVRNAKAKSKIKNLKEKKLDAF